MKIPPGCSVTRGAAKWGPGDECPDDMIPNIEAMKEYAKKLRNKAKAEKKESAKPEPEKPSKPEK